jgi:hypothetical protein
LAIHRSPSNPAFRILRRSPRRASPLDSRKRYSSPAATQQGLVRSVDDRVDGQGRDVRFDDFDHAGISLGTPQMRILA